MKVRILPNQIHHRIEEGKDVLYLDFNYPEYPQLPTYGIKINLPATNVEIKVVIGVHAQKIKEQMSKDEWMRKQLEPILEFDTKEAVGL